MDACCTPCSLTISRDTGPNFSKFLHSRQTITALNMSIDVAIYQFFMECQCHTCINTKNLVKIGTEDSEITWLESRPLNLKQEK